jgi:heme oxygenase (biliverdin-IX-beta and delta-forming)
MHDALTGQTEIVAGRLDRRGAGLRESLRTATSEIHQRLHQHRALAAIAAGQISLADYRSLLQRLLGFYAPLELALGLEPERSQRLHADLDSLAPSNGNSPIPMCPSVPRFKNHAQRLGARYVIEGAALGGRQLAKGLDSLLGRETPVGRLFFIGRGTSSGHAWRAFLSELATLEADTASHDSVIEAACDTFGVCEDWLAGWSRVGAA